MTEKGEIESKAPMRESVPIAYVSVVSSNQAAIARGPTTAPFAFAEQPPIWPYTTLVLCDALSCPFQPRGCDLPIRYGVNATAKCACD